MIRSTAPRKRAVAVTNFGFSIFLIGLNVLTGIALVPVYLRHMPVETYGAWLASGSIIAIVGLCESGISTVVTQQLATARGCGDHAAFSRTAGAAICLSLVLGFMIAALGSSLSLFIPDWVGCPQQSRRALTFGGTLAAMASGIMVIGFVCGAVAQAFQVTFLSNLILLLSSLFSVVAIVAALSWKWGVVALGFGAFCLSAANTFCQAINAHRLWRQHSMPAPTFSLAVCVSLWRRSLGLLIARSASIVGANLQAPVAAIADGAQVSAVLVLTGRLTSLAEMVIERIGSAVMPGLAYASSGGQQAQAHAIREVLAVANVLSGLSIGLALCFTKPFICLWVGGGMFGGNALLIVLGMASFFSVKLAVLSNLLIACGRIGIASRWLAFEVGIRVCAIAPLVASFGVLGIPLSQVVSLTICTGLLSTSVSSGAWLSLSDLWLRGMPGSVSCLLLATAWTMLIPTPVGWGSLLGQAGLCGAAMLGASLIVDPGCRSAFITNLRAIMPLSARKSANAPTLEREQSP